MAMVSGERTQNHLGIRSRPNDCTYRGNLPVPNSAALSPFCQEALRTVPTPIALDTRHLIV
jgi:hypothetical protein